ALHPLDRELQVGDRLHTRMADLLELLVGELRLQRLHEAVRGLAGGIRDHVELDGRHVGATLISFLGRTGTLWRVKRVLAVAAFALAFPAAALAGGGTYPAGDTLGTQVHIQVSDTIPVDPALPQDWATYLGSLVHGTELAKLTLDLMPYS